MVTTLSKQRPKPGVFDGAKLREHRRARDLTQAALAELVSIHSVDISRYERDEVEPSLSVAVRLAAALEIDVKRLLKSDTPSE